MGQLQDLVTSPSIGNIMSSLSPSYVQVFLYIILLVGLLTKLDFQVSDIAWIKKFEISCRNYAVLNMSSDLLHFPLVFYTNNSSTNNLSMLLIIESPHSIFCVGCLQPPQCWDDRGEDVIFTFLLFFYKSKHYGPPVAISFNTWSVAWACAVGVFTIWCYPIVVCARSNLFSGKDEEYFLPEFVSLL